MEAPSGPPPRMRWTPEDYRQRPLDLDRRLVDEILLRLENGETLTALCAENRDYPLPGTFLRWTREDVGIATRYAQALADGTECRFHEIMDAAGSGRPTANLEFLALKHYTERSLPDKYGPRSTVRQVTKPEGEGESDTGGIYAADAGDVRRRIEEIASRREAARRAAEEEPGGDPPLGPES